MGDRVSCIVGGDNLVIESRETTPHHFYSPMLYRLGLIHFRFEELKMITTVAMLRHSMQTQEIIMLAVYRIIT